MPKDLLITYILDHQKS